MAASRPKRIRILQLELSTAEAAWLRAYLQNPIGEGPEHDHDAFHRKAIFDAIPHDIDRL